MKTSDIFSCNDARKLWLMTANAFIFEHKKFVLDIFDNVHLSVSEEERQKIAVTLIADELMETVQSFIDNDNNELFNCLTADLLDYANKRTTQ